jgi:hypothetical protein
MESIGQTKEVQKFISDLGSVSSDKYEIVTDLYRLFTKANDDFSDKFIYGGIGIYLNTFLIGGIYVSKKHVSLVFSDGYKMKDTYNSLDGGGKYRRYIKVAKLEDIELKKCQEYIEQLFGLYT